MIESCFDNHLNVQHATDYMGTYLMYLWAINVIVIIDYNTAKGSEWFQDSGNCLGSKESTQNMWKDKSRLRTSWYGGNPMGVSEIGGPPTG